MPQTSQRARAHVVEYFGRAWAPPGRSPRGPQHDERFPPERLAIAWECTDQPYVREEELKRAYEAEFGERPPHDRA
jgi:hypothetical protein